ncbi:ADP-ribosylation/Crystallin J1 superfamily protein [Tenacibaculum maritimum]|uniref:ADP-ribosylglycohydrolase family protein n=1 Tax=Tenacibaculum maritimum TaxID=107401 RepID=UPI0012E6D2B6|nr:ADP-ribosylglycohydrolase family protein [Tenacibaculum maritimum]CAA0172385.1 ADP-ribosylation/Crystallin J1 superfamily protein [Tenacibaculum maritimum]
MKSKSIESTFLGLALADALGVPVEFQSRKQLQENPVKEMRAFGTHYQPKGTWSDDSSLTFCLAESLCKGYVLNDIAERFSLWYQETIWTPHGKVFDIGNGTRNAIETYLKGTAPIASGGSSETNNGNGSLMRISPIAFYVKKLPIEKRFETIKEVSSITHAHIRAIISCFIYIEFFIALMDTDNMKLAYDKMQKTVLHFLNSNALCAEKEMKIFYRVLNTKIYNYTEKEIYSSGYVVHTLEASLWCLLGSTNYTETVLKAINLGEDTDTTATVAGAVAGMHYGLENVPLTWINSIVKKEDIICLSKRFSKKYGYVNKCKTGNAVITTVGNLPTKM